MNSVPSFFLIKAIFVFWTIFFFSISGAQFTSFCRRLLWSRNRRLLDVRLTNNIRKTRLTRYHAARHLRGRILPAEGKRAISTCERKKDVRFIFNGLRRSFRRLPVFASLLLLRYARIAASEPNKLKIVSSRFVYCIFNADRKISESNTGVANNDNDRRV